MIEIHVTYTHFSYLNLIRLKEKSPTGGQILYTVDMGGNVHLKQTCCFNTTYLSLLILHNWKLQIHHLNE